MAEQTGAYKVAMTAVTGTTAGGVFSIANPEGADVIITNMIVDVTTEATGSATIDAGVAANGTTSADTLFDALDVGAAAGTFNNVDDQGTNGKHIQKWGSSEYVTGTASATLAGLVGNVYIEYIRE